MQSKEIKKQVYQLLKKEKRKLKAHLFLADEFKESKVGIGEIISLNKQYALILFDGLSQIKISLMTFKHMVNEIKEDCPLLDQHISYIVIERKDIQFLRLIANLDELYQTKDSLMIAIDGYAASGKSTLAKRLSNLYGAHVFHTDDFFKKIEIDRLNPLSKHGSHIDFKKINETILASLKERKNVFYRPFDFKTHQHLEPTIISYNSFNILEGAYSMHPELKTNYDYRIFLKVSLFHEYLRIYKRNGLKRLLLFIKKWIPRERRYFKAYHIEEKADLVIKSKK